MFAKILINLEASKICLHINMTLLIICYKQLNDKQEIQKFSFFFCENKS